MRSRRPHNYLVIVFSVFLSLCLLMIIILEICKKSTWLEVIICWEYLGIWLGLSWNSTWDPKESTGILDSYLSCGILTLRPVNNCVLH
jgi:hypothetical protein